MSRLGRGPVVLALLVLGLLVVAIATRPWVTAIAPSPGAGTQSVVGEGSAVSPAGALGLVVMATAGAMLLARRVVVVVLAVVVLLAGAGAAWSALRVVLDPVSAALPVVARSAGLTEASVPVAEVEAQATGWAVTGVVLAVLVVLLAGLALVRGRSWGTSRRYERDDVQDDPRPSGAGAGAGAPAVAEGATSRPDAVADDWDALTRGDDPTARD